MSEFLWATIANASNGFFLHACYPKRCRLSTSNMITGAPGAGSLFKDHSKQPLNAANNFFMHASYSHEAARQTCNSSHSLSFCPRAMLVFWCTVCDIDKVALLYGRPYDDVNDGRNLVGSDFYNLQLLSRSHILSCRLSMSMPMGAENRQDLRFNSAYAEEGKKIYTSMLLVIGYKFCRYF